MTVGILVWAYTLLLPSFADAGIVGQRILTEGPWGIALLRPQALLGLDLPPLVHGVVWSLALNVLAYVAFSFARAPASIERLQADLFVPSGLTPITPSFRLWRSSVTVEELTTTVARYLGEERTRTSFDSYALTRGIEPRSQERGRLPAAALRRAPARLGDRRGLLAARAVAAAAQAHGVDQGRAQAARRRQCGDPLQPRDPADRARPRAPGHRGVRQGPAADLLEPAVRRDPRRCRRSSPGSAPRSTRSCATTPAARRWTPRTRSTRWCASGIARYVSGSEPFLERFAERDLVMEVRANPMPDGGIVTTFTDITPSVKAAEELERANESLERRVRERTEELTRLNAELGRAKARSRAGQHLEDAIPRRREPRHPAAAQRRAPLRHQPGRAAGRRRGRAARRQYRRLARRGRGDLRRAARHLAPRHRRDEAGDRQLPHRRAAAPARGRVRAAGAGKGLAARLRALLARGAIRPPAAAAAAAEPRLERHQVHAQGPRAGRLPAPPRPAAHRRLRHRARHPALEEAGDLPGVPSSRPGRQGGARARARPLDRGAHRARARPQGRGRLDGRPRLAVLASRCRSPPPLRRAATGARQRARSIAGSSPASRVLCIDNELDHPRRHGDAARRLGLPRRQGGRPRVGDRRAHGERKRRRTPCWSTITSTTATASTAIDAVAPPLRRRPRPRS